MGDKLWKQAERQIAARLGGVRVPVTGRGCGDAPDIQHPHLAIEVKQRATLPAWLLDAMEQAKASARAGQVPVVVLHRSGDRFDAAFVVQRLRDFLAGHSANGSARPSLT